MTVSSIAMSDAEIVDAVREVMNRYEIRQIELAREIGLTQGRVSQILTGKVRIPNKTKLDLFTWTTNRRVGKRPSTSGAVIARSTARRFHFGCLQRKCFVY